MKTGAPLPSAVLLPLTAVVLAAHVWVLQPPARRVQVSPPARAPAFATRRIEPPRPQAGLPPQPAPHGMPAPDRARPLPGRIARAAVAMKSARGRDAPAVTSNSPAPAADLAPVALLPPMQLRYDVTAQVNRQQVQGSSALHWEHDGQRYTASFETSVAGLRPRRQSSQGDVTALGLAPLRFGEQLRGEQAAHFEREQGRVSFSNNRPPVPLLAGAQDRVSVLFQLAAMLAGDSRRSAPGTSMAIQTATTRDAEPWLFTVEGEETLHLGGADMTTVKLVRPPRGEYDQRMEVWLAPGKAYAPVRLRLTQPNGDWADHQWSATDSR
jgi:hypothetical protein